MLNYKTPEDNIRELMTLALQWVFRNNTKNHYPWKKKLLSWTFLKLKNSALWWTLLRKWKKPQTWRKYLQKTSGKGLISKLYKEFLQLNNNKKNGLNWAEGTFLVVQWLRIHLPMEKTQVRSLVWEDSTCHGILWNLPSAVHHNYWSPNTLEPVLLNKRVAPTWHN